MKFSSLPGFIPFIFFLLTAMPAGLAKDQGLYLTGTKPLPPLPDDAGAFTLVIIPDTQSYFGKGCKLTPDSKEAVTNPGLEAQVKWIREHRDAQRIAFVSHVGDIVEKDRPEEWAVARRHLDTLLGVVPFSLTVGNHDMNDDGEADLFQQHFPAAGFASFPWYLGSYTHTRKNQSVSANNVNSAHVFRAGGMDFLHLSLECNAPDDVVAWANDLLTKHTNRRALITTHMDLGIIKKPKDNDGFIDDPKGRMRWGKIHGKRGNTGEELWDKLYRHHSNLGFVFSGDQSRVTTLMEVRTGDHGNAVVSLLSDYLSQPALRLMRFVPSANEVQVLTYHVEKEVLVEDTTFAHDPASHQFRVPYRMR